MPRERIQAMDPETFDVVVSWNKELNDYVEIVTLANDPDERLRSWVESVDGKETKPGTSFQFFTGWHCFLNRAQINELIRVLRRARNSAFGADE